jgi:hypothetical protein
LDTPFYNQRAAVALQRIFKREAKVNNLQARAQQRRIFIFGNGGSAANAAHDHLEADQFTFLGDGSVKIAEAKPFGGIAIGVASSDARRSLVVVFQIRL